MPTWLHLVLQNRDTKSDSGPLLSSLFSRGRERREGERGGKEEKEKRERRKIGEEGRGEGRGRRREREERERSTDLSFIWKRILSLIDGN